jgi:hypothetical protein
MAQRRTTMQVNWPVHPRYNELDPLGPHGYAAWAHYKLWSADWYLRVLRDLGEGQVPDYDRYLGVEMAIDGVTAALCGAFDTAVVALTTATEANYPEHVPTRFMTSGWTRYKRVADKPNVGRAPCASAVEAALEGERADQPKGWMAQLRRLRNRVTHETTAARGHYAGGGTDRCDIKVPGLGDVDPVEYLNEMSGKVRGLVMLVLSDAVSLNPAAVFDGVEDSFTATAAAGYAAGKGTAYDAHIHIVE